MRGTGTAIHLPNGPEKTKCGLDIVQKTKRGPAELSLASQPRYVSCKNCLSLIYERR